MSTRADPGTIDSSSPARSSSLVYLYGIVEAGTPAHRLLKEQSIPGLDPGDPLFAVESAGLVAAVSFVSAEAFQEQPLNELVADLPRLASYAVRHEVAVGRLVHDTSAVVPMGFGAVYRDAERVAGVLRDRGGEFHQLLDRVRGKQEWGLKVVADPRQLQSNAAAQSDELHRLDADAAKAGRGRAYLLRKQRERLLQAEVDRSLGLALEDVLGTLTAASVETRQDELPAEQPIEGPRLVLRAAFLVEGTSVDRFNLAATKLAERHRSAGLTVDVSGPWAPYSFVGNDNR